MNKIVYLFVLMLTLHSCKKENELDGILLRDNSFETNDLPFVIIKNATIINCNILALDLEVFYDRFPDTLEYTHYQITEPLGDVIHTKKTETIYVNALCNQPSEYTVQLYNQFPERTSIPSSFIFNEW